MAVFLLALYVSLLFVRPMDWWTPVRNWQLVNATAIATMLVAFPRAMNEFRAVWRIPQAKLIIALLAGVTLSWVYPTWIGGMTLSFQTFGKIVVVLFLLILLLVRDDRSFRTILWTVLLCAAWMGVHGVLQIRTGAGFGGSKPLIREYVGDAPIYQIHAFGWFHDPNDLCLVFIMAMPLLWAAYKATPNPAAKIAALGFFPLYASGAYLTNSRGGIVGVFGMVAAHAIARTKGVRRYIMAAFALTLVTIAMPARGAQLGIIDFDRINAWGAGIGAFKSHPIFGIGYGDFGSLTDGKAAHNSYVEILAECGLVGYIPWCLLIYFTIVYMRRLLSVKHLLPRAEQFFLTGFFSALAGYLTAFYFLSRAYHATLYILIALAVCRVVIICRNNPQLQEFVFGQMKQDFKRGLMWAFGSVPFLWITIRIANAMRGG